MPALITRPADYRNAAESMACLRKLSRTRSHRGRLQPSKYTSERGEGEGEVRVRGGAVAAWRVHLGINIYRRESKVWPRMSWYVGRICK
jgi:hypothetical protein